MAMPIINLNPIDPNLGSCNFVLKYGEQITFKLEYNGGITLGLKIYEFEFNWTTHSE
jgi:recombinational DNA repair protein RecT